MPFEKGRSTSSASGRLGLIDIIAGVGNRARIAGFDVVEFYPPADLGSLTALTAARFLVNVIGQVARP